jgi:hypothetical protein
MAFGAAWTMASTASLMLNTGKERPFIEKAVINRDIETFTVRSKKSI